MPRLARAPRRAQEGRRAPLGRAQDDPTPGLPLPLGSGLTLTLNLTLTLANPRPCPRPSPSPNADQVRKMETLLYELSLVERSGRVREAPLEVPGEPYRASGDGGGEMEPV